MKQWMIVTEEKCRGAAQIAAAVQKHVPYVLPVGREEQEDFNPIYVRIVPGGDAVCIDVEPYDAASDRQVIRITVADACSLLYAASDFENIYLPYAEESPDGNVVFFRLFEEPMKEYHAHSSPYIKRRGLWTWGHVIYDYKKYIDHMAALKLNDLTIWNDYVPVNMQEVIDYAHSCGVQVRVGFAWGWDTTMPDISRWEEIAEEVIEKYRREYLSVPCDGIYFQTFTEHREETLNGLNVARTAVSLVNRVSHAIWELTPELDIQFGLHAGSVIKHLDAFDALDPRISIIWEDVGAFPYSYLPYQTEGFEETLELSRRLQKIGGSENGAVLKGVICLDWTKFHHQTGPYYMGVQSFAHRPVSDTARKKLRMVQAYWMANMEQARQMVASFSEGASLYALVEDGYFENCIQFPTAAYAQMMWDPHLTREDLIRITARRPDVTFF